jgi:mannose-1-phosphate guanylyltransferase
MKAMVLAAGKGTRLGELGQMIPKVLLPLQGEPLLGHTFRWLKRNGVTQVAINVNHHHQQVIDYVGDGFRLGLPAVFSHEDKLLGTAGGVKKMEHFFDDTFIVAYGDILTGFDLDAMVRFHKQKKAAATLALIEVADPSSFGIVETETSGRISRFVEKPEPGATDSNLASAAVYVLETKIFHYIPENKFCDFGFDVFPQLLKAGAAMYGYTLGTDDYFMDVGTPEKYRKANDDFGTGKVGRELQDNFRA